MPFGGLHYGKEGKGLLSRDPLIIIVCALAAFLSYSIAGSSWWLVVVVAAIIGAVSFFSMLG